MALLWIAAGLLVVAGAAKVVDPSRTSGALAAMGWPSSPALVLAGALGELLLGSATLVWGGRVLAGLVAASFLGFTGFLVAALATGRPVGTCGCLGRVDTRPRVGHALATLALAAGSAWVAVS